MKHIVLQPVATQAATFNKAGSNLWRKQVLRFGRFIHPNDSTKFWEVTREYVEQLVKNFRDKVFGMVSIPRGHNEDDPNLNTGEVVDLSVEQDGLYATVRIDHPETNEGIAAGRVADVSVGISNNYVHKESGKEVGPVLRHLALTNVPYIKNMRKFEPVEPVQIAASEYADVLFFSEDAMDKNQLIAELLKLGIDVAKLEKDSAALADLLKVNGVTSLSELAAKLTPPQKDDKQKVEAAEEITKLTERVNATETENKTLRDKLEAAEAKAKKDRVTAQVEAAVKEGKLEPKHKDDYIKMGEKDEETLKLVLSTLKTTIELGERGTDTSANDFTKLSEADAVKQADEITKNFGNIIGVKTAKA